MLIQDSELKIRTNFINFITYFLKKYPKKNYCILLNTTHGIIKGMPKLLTSDLKQTKLNFDTYLKDFSKFVTWYNSAAFDDATNLLFVATASESKITSNDAIPYIEIHDAIVVNEATLYANNQKFEFPSYLLYSTTITGISIVPKDYEPLSF